MINFTVADGLHRDLKAVRRSHHAPHLKI
jgi:hypothetical protein